MLHKSWVPLIIANLLLQGCGTETGKIKKDPKYIYVEIEECTIPIPESYDIATDGNNEPYQHKYIGDKNIENYRAIATASRQENDVERAKKITEKTLSTLSNKSLKESIFNRDNFKIYEVTLLSKIASKTKTTNYHLFGKNTQVILINSNEIELNYLLNYCKKTWKLNKGEKNVK